MSKKRLYLFYHIAGCAIFLALALVLYPHPPDQMGDRFSRPTQRDFLANVLMLGFFYCNYYWLIPRLYFRKNYVSYVLSIVFALVVIVILPSLLTGRVPWHAGGPGGPGGPPKGGFPRGGEGPLDILAGGPHVHVINPSFFEEISHHIFVFFMVVLFSLFLRVRSRMLMAERQRLDAELVSLKAQISPHFLFNALNSIYSLTVKKEDAAPGAVINLSELMRYMMKDATKAQVPVQVELDYINNYVQLQKSRVGNTATIEFTMKGDPADKTIAPLLLIAFIENAFKYGINPDEESVIRIQLEIIDNQLLLLVRNRKVVSPSRVESTGIGIPNAQERLALLYAGKHTLAIHDEAGYFLVTLTILLQ